MPHARGLPIVTLFPGVIYGPGLATEGNLVGRLISDHRARRLPGLIGADKPWSYAYVDDVANAHVAALERGRSGAEYRLGGVNAAQMRVFEIAARSDRHTAPAAHSVRRGNTDCSR